jgi:hypothetical protein
MQRIKVILFSIFVLFSLVGCSAYGDKRQINYPVKNIIELNKAGKQINVWNPVSGSIYVYINFDVVEFIDSGTNKKKQIVNSYKFNK